MPASSRIFAQGQVPSWAARQATSILITVSSPFAVSLISPRTSRSLASSTVISMMAERTFSSLISAGSSTGLAVDEVGQGILGFKFHTEPGQGHTQLFQLLESGPETGPADFDGHTGLATPESARHIVGLDLLRPPPSQPCLLMDVQRIAVDGPYATGPFQGGLLKSVCRTDLDPPADIAFHTLGLVDRRLLFAHPDGPHGAPVDTALAADAFILVDEHALTSCSLPAVVPFSLLEPFFRPPFRDEVQVIV